MKKQKEKSKDLLNRRRPYQSPHEFVLIVCEGSKTEPKYFSALRNELKLSHANIRICGKECGSSPISVVDYAIEEFKKTGDYKRVYCVFDKDRHETYEAALDKAFHTKLRAGVKLFAITSVPCFEFWLLLHFEDTARPYGAIGNNSSCDQVTRDLKKHIPDYAKGDNKTFKLTYPKVEQAIKRSELLEQRQEKALTDNPSTKVHTLVAYLQGLKSNV